MQKRYAAIWFRYLKTDWFANRNPASATKPFVLFKADHGRMVITAANKPAEAKGIYKGTVLADARAVFPALQAVEEQPEQFDNILLAFAEWFIRYSPVVAADSPDGLLIDASGCTHLWGGEQAYITQIQERLRQFGYTVHTAIAGTIGLAWAACRFGAEQCIIENGREAAALQPLPPEALRLSPDVVERLYKLGLRQVTDFIQMPQPVLRRRFGEDLIIRLNQALGNREEYLNPVVPAEPYQERLTCIEPVSTATAIEIALQKLLDALCGRLQQQEKGLRRAIFKAYRIDGKTEQINIGLNHPGNDAAYLFNLFALKIETIEPALGIELFVLEALDIEDHYPLQDSLWHTGSGLPDAGLSRLIDRIANKIGEYSIYRYLPDEHYWPEWSVKRAVGAPVDTKTSRTCTNPRPVRLLPRPEPIHVTAPVPDYPPMLFRYKGRIHKIVRADGPERIEQEWWIQDGPHRDYYYVEDEAGNRYWLFRLGHYDNSKPVGWFLHGFCA